MVITERCFMAKDGECSGGIDLSICGKKCPFRKTKSEQQKIEDKIVARFKENNTPIKYISRLTGEVVYDGFEEV